MPPRYRINHLIRVPQVKLIDVDGKMAGVMETWRALKIAEERGLDLVEIGATVTPPIVKIMDYGKFMYTKAKEARKEKKHSVELKNIRIGIKTSPHDLAIKAKKADEFLTEGHQVRVEVFLRGREKAHRELCRPKIDAFLKCLTMSYNMDGFPRMQPSGMSVVVTRKK